MAAIEMQRVAVEKNVPFGRGGARDLLCDIYRPPAGREKRVAVIQYHGGQFLGGSKEGTRVAEPLAAILDRHVANPRVYPSTEPPAR